MPDQTKGNGMLLGVVIGGTVGVLATLLLAPKSGAKMREELSEKYQSLCDKTKDIAATVGDATRGIVGSVKEESVNLAEQAKESNQNIKASLAASTEEIKDRLSATDK